MLQDGFDDLDAGAESELSSAERKSPSSDSVSSLSSSGGDKPEATTADAGSQSESKRKQNSHCKSGRHDNSAKKPKLEVRHVRASR